MAKRWIGLTRPPKTSSRRRSAFAHGVHAVLHMTGAAGAIATAIAFNVLVFPDVLTSSAYAQSPFDGRIGFFSSDSMTAAIPPPEVDEAEVHLLAATAWAEARSEGEDGMRAVANVMVNRIGSRFGEDLETVILAPKQFSAWNLGDPNRPLAQNPERYARAGVDAETWEAAQKVAREVLQGVSADPTSGALFYHTRAISPYWSHYGEGRVEIGAHVFYRDVPDQPRARRYASSTRRANTNLSASNETRLGPRAGRVNGVIQHAPRVAVPAPTSVASEPEIDPNAT